jgi:cytochrome P450
MINHEKTPSLPGTSGVSPTNTKSTNTVRKQAPGPSGIQSLKKGMEFLRDPIKVLEDAPAEYGPIVRFKLGGKKALYLIHEPEHLEHVLLKNNRNYEKSSPYGLIKLLFGKGLLFNEGESWFKQRRMLQPTFQPKKFSTFANGIQEAVVTTVAEWQQEEDGKRTNVEAEMARLARKMIGFTLFGATVPDHINKVLDTDASKMSMLLGNLPLTPQNISLRKQMIDLDKTVYSIIEERRNLSDDAPMDILNTLLTASDKDTGEVMSEKQLRDEIVTLLFSGFDTTSRTMSWAFHAMSENPEVEAKLHAEIDEVLAGRTPAYEDLPNLKYTTMLVQETMRMYPPNAIIGREAQEDDVIGGYHIPKGSFITLSSYLAHRNPAMWDSPEVFNPERFADQAESKLPRFAYFPFGGGPRQCIGKGLAMMTIPLAIATIAQQYRYCKVPDFTVEHDMKLTFQSRHGIMTTRHLRPAMSS